MTIPVFWSRTHLLTSTETLPFGYPSETCAQPSYVSRVETFGVSRALMSVSSGSAAPEAANFFEYVQRPPTLRPPPEKLYF